MVDSPSARKALPSVAGVAGRPTIWPMARQLPVVSAMMTIIASVMIRIGASPNAGRPKAKGALNSNHAAWPTCAKSVSPKTAAIAVPATSPSSTARLPTKPPKRA